MFGNLISKITGSKNKDDEQDSNIDYFYQEKNINEIKDKDLDIPLIDNKLIREDEKDKITFVINNKFKTFNIKD